MKRVLLLFAVLLGSLHAGAQQLDYLTFRTSDGTEKSLPIDGLKITFEGMQMHATVQQQKVVFPLAELAIMFFSETATAVEKIEMNKENITIVDGRVWVNGTPATTAKVYNLTGCRVANHQLQQGVYLVKINGKTYKLMAK